MVWALDVVGLFMYGELFHVALELVPALGSLLVMVFGAGHRPTLSTSTSVRNLLPAGFARLGHDGRTLSACPQLRSPFR